jgi:hypothetical protein
MILQAKDYGVDYWTSTQLLVEMRGHVEYDGISTSAFFKLLQRYQQEQQHQQDQQPRQDSRTQAQKQEDEARERVIWKQATIADSKVRTFLKDFYFEVREIICNPRKQSDAAKMSRKGMIPGSSALATLVMVKLGYPEPLAVGFATYLFIVIAESSRAAFCKGHGN